MIIKSFIVGMLSTNCYIVTNSKKESIIIDPGFESNREFENIIEYINEKSLNVKLIVNTHGHADHISGNSKLQKKYKCPISIHRNDSEFLESLDDNNRIIFLEDGDFLDFGKDLLRVILTPGHTPGSISLIGKNVVFTGDTLFSKGIGRMDFPGGSREDMKKSISKLMSLPDEWVVYSGHGILTTIGEERKFNPFIGWL